MFSALKSHNSNKYYINGNWVIDLPKGYDVADTTVYYTRPRRDKGKNEAFIAAGPTSEDLDVMVRRNKQTTLNAKLLVTIDRQNRALIFFQNSLLFADGC